MNAWIAGLGIWGPVVLGLVYIVATVLFVPGTILSLAAGAMFGLGVGVVTISIASTIGASLAFLIARYVARDRVAVIASRNRRFGAIDRAIGEAGWKIVALLRLSPAVPFNLQNYLYGLTPIRFWPYVLTSWIAMFPGTFLYIYLGHITGAALGSNRSRSAGEWAFLAIGLAATVMVTVYITRLARQKLSEQMTNAPAETMITAATETSKDRRAVHARSRIRTTLYLVTTAAIFVGLAAYVRANTEAIEQSLTGLFGPSSVESQEAYADDEREPDFDHSVFDSLLRQHVDADGWVDYAGIRKDEVKLEAYLDSLANAPFTNMGRNQKLALLINAYNAFTLKLIVEHQPATSIKDIARPKRWGAARWNVGGQVWSLDQIEHKQIRPKFVEPRIHFALVCAAVGCPPLRNEAFSAARLDNQLDEQAKYVHQHATWFQFDAQNKSLRLTKLYDWYGDDFEQDAGSVPQFAARYSAELRQALASDATPRVKWLPYDWKLNSIQNKRPR